MKEYDIRNILLEQSLGGIPKDDPLRSSSTVESRNFLAVYDEELNDLYDFVDKYKEHVMNDFNGGPKAGALGCVLNTGNLGYINVNYDTSEFELSNPVSLSTLKKVLLLDKDVAWKNINLIPDDLGIFLMRKQIDLAKYLGLSVDWGQGAMKLGILGPELIRNTPPEQRGFQLRVLNGIAVDIRPVFFEY